MLWDDNGEAVHNRIWRTYEETFVYRTCQPVASTYKIQSSNVKRLRTWISLSLRSKSPILVPRL